MRQTTIRARLLAASALVGMAIGVPLAAQEPETPAPFTERIEVELVTVDVWVEDRQGNAVTGLSAEDFEVLHDGRPVATSHFTEVRAGMAVAAVTPEGAGGVEGAEGDEVASAGAVPAHVVVYFDQSRLHPSNYPPLIRGLEELLDAEAVDPGNVLILRQNNGLAIEAPFGSSQSELRAALGRLTKGTARGADVKSEVEQALEEIRRSWEQNQDAAASASVGIASIPSSTPGGSTTGVPGGGPRATVGGVGTAGGSDACGSFLGQIQPVLSSWARSRAARTAVTLSNLSDISGFLAGLPGVKTLLYLSDGLDTSPGSALASYAAGFCPSGSAQLMGGARSEDMTPRFLELTRHANSNRVTVYALQATGLESPGVASASRGRRARRGSERSQSSFEQSQRSSDRRGIELIARETGGRTLVNQNDFASELRKIARESQTYYSLAYQPPAAGEGREHRIEVKLKDDSLVARYRQGYLEKDKTQWLTERIEGALNLGLADNPLEIRLGAGEVAAGTEPATYRMPLLVMVPAERLAFLPGADGSAAEVVVRVLARALDSATLAIFDKTFQIKGAPGATGFAQLAIELELAGGPHLTAVGVQDVGSGEASFVSTTLQLGDGG